MNYIKKILDMAPTIPPGFHHLIVAHDDWCAHFRGGPCNCDPTVRIVSANQPPAKRSRR